MAAAAKVRSAYQAYAKGDTEKAINDWAEAFILTVMAVYGPLTRLTQKLRIRRSERLKQRRDDDVPDFEEVKWDETHPLIEGTVDKPRPHGSIRSYSKPLQTKCRQVVATRELVGGKS